MRLREKVAFITGGSRGIGRAIAVAYARESATVALMARSSEALREVERAAADAGGTAISFTGDVTAHEDVALALEETSRRFGHIDVLVNNAGCVEVAPFLEMSDEAWQRMLEVNVLGVVRCSREVIRHMAPRKSGHIINISSVAGRLAPRFMSSYATSKAAVIALTRAMAAEFTEHGIAVNAINPGMVETDLADDISNGLGGCLGKAPEDVRQALVGAMPLGRFLTPEEIADAAVWLATMRSPLSYTGQCIDINGGRLFV